MSRARIKHPDAHTRLRWGRRPPQFDPSFEVARQNEPTPQNPISQHKQFKGHTAGGMAHPKIPK